MTRGRLVFVAAAGLGVLGGCGSDDSGDGTGGAASSSSTVATSGSGGTGGDATPANSCAKPGDKGNDKGVGEYCTPSGGECADFPDAPLCLASVGQDQWFCTRIGCDETTDCGEGAGCHIEGGSGSACVPCRCDSSPAACSGGGGAGGGAGGTGGSAGGAGAGGSGGG